jgi:hypothetical protein
MVSMFMILWDFVITPVVASVVGSLKNERL